MTVIEVDAAVTEMWARFTAWLHVTLVNLAWWVLNRLEPSFPYCRCPHCQDEAYEGLKLVHPVREEVSRVDQTMRFCVNCHNPLPDGTQKFHDGRWLCIRCKQVPA